MRPVSSASEALGRGRFVSFEVAGSLVMRQPSAPNIDVSICDITHPAVI